MLTPPPTPCYCVVKGAEEVSVEDAPNGVQLLSFSSAMGVGGGGTFSLMELKFKFHVKESLRQVMPPNNPLAMHPLLAIHTQAVIQ